MVSIQPGEIFKTSESTSPGAAPLIDIGVTALSPLISGHTVSATVSTPGVARRRSITWAPKHRRLGTMGSGLPD